jgi:ParB-like chromosome segregation protein Spo0J
MREGEGVTLAHAIEVDIAQLRHADTPRLGGEDSEHIKMLAALDVPLPPIIVHRQTMRVIDGMHRLRAAELRGDHRIEVTFFDGSVSDAFAIAVRANVSHGLPLSVADRSAAARRLLESHPNWSDRALAVCTGLSAKAIAALRRCTNDALPQEQGRIGRDGKVRPIDSGEGRRAASRLLAERPDASLREIASAAGVSPATVRDVRARIERGEDPIPAKVKRTARKSSGAVGPGAEPAGDLLRTLQKDPSLRLTESGRVLLRLLSWPLMEAQAREQLVTSVPPHCVDLVSKVARECASSWHKFADELADRDQSTVA